jgi:hypothetical protein
MPAQENGHDETNSFGSVFFSGGSWNRQHVTGAGTPPSSLLVSASSSRLQSVLAEARANEEVGPM